MNPLASEDSSASMASPSIQPTPAPQFGSGSGGNNNNNNNGSSSNSGSTPSTPLLSALPSLPSFARREGSEYLLLEVFGIQRPGEEFTKHFVQMIESKLANSTLDVISTLLARNSTLKLTPADVEFILPMEQPPQMKKLLAIPSIISNPFELFLYLKQNLLQFLNTMSLNSESDVALKQQFLRKHRIDPEEADLERGSEKWAGITPHDCVFIYNHVQAHGPVASRNPTAIQAAVGHGIACVCLSVVDESEKVLFSLNNLPGDQAAPFPHEKVLEVLDFMLTDAGLEFRSGELFLCLCGRLQNWKPPFSFSFSFLFLFQQHKQEKKKRAPPPPKKKKSGISKYAKK
jgi:hypothetical protein